MLDTHAGQRAYAVELRTLLDLPARLVHNSYVRGIRVNRQMLEAQVSKDTDEELLRVSGEGKLWNAASAPGITLSLGDFRFYQVEHIPEL